LGAFWKEVYGVAALTIAEFGTVRAASVQISKKLNRLESSHQVGPTTMTSTATATTAATNAATPATATPAVSTQAALHVTRITGGDELAALAEGWNRLAADIPFRRHEWLESWWRHYRTPHCELFVLQVADATGLLVGVAPWYLEKSKSRGRIVRFLGSGEVASDYVGVLAADGHEAAVPARLAEWLSIEGAGRWDLIDLDGIASDDIVTLGLAAEMKVRGHALHRRERFRTWRASLPRDWNEYLMGLSKSRRERARQLWRRNFETGRAVLHVVKEVDDVARGIDVLRTLHQSRRESLGEAGCFASSRFGGFHLEVARKFLELGRLRLQWLELDGRAVAAEYSLEGGDTVYYYQSGFDAELADARPGWLALVASLRLAIEQGFRSFDFLRGDEPYKASLGAEPRPLIELRVVGRNPTARLRNVAWVAAEGMKAWIKRGLQLCRRGTRPGDARARDAGSEKSGGEKSPL
jgi:CelD/BcsL family acetyltransferase involved in cellulose biosynthesis